MDKYVIMYIIGYILLSIVFIAASMYIYRLGYRRGLNVMAPKGTLLINTINAESETLSLELHCTIGELMTNDYVIFNVENRSQEKPLA